MLDASRSLAQRIEKARADATSYLVACQSPEGGWQDFDLPVGRSDAWVTAIAALQLIRQPETSAKRAARKAAHWLISSGRSGCWGYNDDVPPDADSTAWATFALAKICPDHPATDLDFLARHQHPDGGVATYISGDFWGRPHGCVTAIVAQAFEQLGARDRADRARTWLSAEARAGRSGGYWWASPFFPAWAILSALHDPVALPRLDVARSVFDLACALRIAAMLGRQTKPLTTTLCALQDTDGGWPASRCLRVTYHWVAAPDAANEPGIIYADTSRVFGTAFCLAALSDLRSREMM